MQQTTTKQLRHHANATSHTAKFKVSSPLKHSTSKDLQSELNHAIDNGIVLIRAITTPAKHNEAIKDAYESCVETEIRKIIRKKGMPTRTKAVGEKDGNLNRTATLIAKISLAPTQTKFETPPLEVFAQVGYVIVNPDLKDIKFVCEYSFGSGKGKKQKIDHKIYYSNIDRKKSIEDQLKQLKTIVESGKTRLGNEVILDIKNNGTIQYIFFSTSNLLISNEIPYSLKEKKMLAIYMQQKFKEKMGVELPIVEYDSQKSYPRIYNDIKEINELRAELPHYLIFEAFKDSILNENLAKTENIIKNVNNINTQYYTGETLLHVVASTNLTNIINKIIAKGADINIQNENGSTPLHIAIANNQPDTVKLLIKNRADIHIQNQNGNTPLHIADANNQLETVKLLLEKGADIHRENNSCCSPLYDAIRYGHTEIAKMMIAKGKDNYNEKDGHISYLHIAASNNQPEIIKILLKKYKNINIVSIYGQTPLHVALNNNNSTISKLFIENGADINKQDKDGNTCLHLAISNHLPEIAKLILSKNVDINKQDKYGNTPLHTDLNNFNPEIASLLIKMGADINKQDQSGSTPLHIAVSRRNVEICKQLLEKGADLHLKNLSGDTPLNLAKKMWNRKDFQIINKYNKSKLIPFLPF